MLFYQLQSVPGIALVEANGDSLTNFVSLRHTTPKLHAAAVRQLHHYYNTTKKAMVRHQTGGIEAAAQLLFPFPQILKVILVIVVVGKNDLAIMPALDHMMRNIGENDPSGTQHGRQD